MPSFLVLKKKKSICLGTLVLPSGAALCPGNKPGGCQPSEASELRPPRQPPLTVDQHGLGSPSEQACLCRHSGPERPALQRYDGGVLFEQPTALRDRVSKLDSGYYKLKIMLFFHNASPTYKTTLKCMAGPRGRGYHEAGPAEP